MAAIISLKKRYDAAGHSVRFQYRDQDIDNERIERALKRRKGPMNAPTCERSEHAR